MVKRGIGEKTVARAAKKLKLETIVIDNVQCWKYSDEEISNKLVQFHKDIRFSCYCPSSKGSGLIETGARRATRTGTLWSGKLIQNFGNGTQIT